MSTRRIGVFFAAAAPGPCSGGQDGRFPPGTLLAAITRDERHVDVFGVDTFGALCLTYERNNAEWLPTPRKITPDDSYAAPSHLAGLVRNAGQTDVFVVDPHREIATVYKTTPADDGPWHTLSLSGPLAPPGASIAAVVREDRDDEVVFVVDDHGAIQHTAMRNNSGWSVPAPIKLQDQVDLFAPAGAPISAVADGSDRTDLYFMDGQGALVRLYTDGGAPWARLNASAGLYTVSSPKVRSMKFECRTRFQCSRGNRR